MTSIPTFFSLFQDQLTSLTHYTRVETTGLVRLTVFLDFKHDIRTLICKKNTEEKFYFKNKTGAIERGGVGSALVIQEKAPQHAETILNHLWQLDPKIKVFGGMNFFPDQLNKAEWRAFNPYRFTLPFLEIKKTKQTVRIVLTYYQPNNPRWDDIKEDISTRLKKIDLNTPSHGNPISDKESKITLFPDQNEWRHIVDSALSYIKTSKIQKIVLARKKIITHQNAWHPFDILKHLSNTEEDSFLYLYHISNSNAFLGKSPERLFKIDNRELSADAIAGSSPRGRTNQEDIRLENKLRLSAKDLEEHRIVTAYIEKQMEMFCSSFEIKEKESILKLKNIQHIISKYKGRLNTRINPFTVLQSFHPTPAVGGHPSQTALDLIKKLEPFERGWYAGPIGWMNRDNAEFAVGIRSALINHKDLHIFAGAGIVNQSTAQGEWMETENKMANFSDLTGGG